MGIKTIGSDVTCVGEGEPLDLCSWSLFHGSRNNMKLSKGAHLSVSTKITLLSPVRTNKKPTTRSFFF
jgi:hypothetical protein